MSETSPVLPNAWIQQLLKRLRSIYGNRVEVVYGTVDETDFAATWREELGTYDGSDIKAALSALRGTYPDYPPTLFQFANLCRDAKRERTGTTPLLEAPRYTGPIDAKVAEMMAKAFDPSNRPHPRAWAKRVLERAAEGEPVGLYAIDSAKAALGIPA